MEILTHYLHQATECLKYRYIYNVLLAVEDYKTGLLIHYTAFTLTSFLGCIKLWVYQKKLQKKDLILR